LPLIPLVRFANLTNRTVRELQAERHDPLFSFSFTSSHE
jgi:hypothetical protein